MLGGRQTTLIKREFNTKQWMKKDNKTVVRVVKHPLQFCIW